MENFLHQEKKTKSRRGWKTAATIIAVLFVLIVSVYFLLYVPVNGVKTQAVNVVAAAKTVSQAFKENDIDKLGKNLQELRVSYNLLQKRAGQLYWLGYVPLISGYAQDLKRSVTAGDEVIQALMIAESAVAPYADLIGFKKGSTGFLEQSADERIQTAVLTLDKVVVKADDIADHLEKARIQIAGIDEKRYPAKIGQREIRGKIQTVKEQFEEFSSLFVEAKPFFKKLPAILGAEEEKTYLILFQNDKELRPTGGFLTAYAIFKVKNGKFQVITSEDIYSLDTAIPSHPKAPQEILTYHKDVSRFNIRDSNLSPDLLASLKLFNSLYETSSKKVKYDGIITVDTQVLVDTLTILGDTEADGVKFSANNDKRCNCPQVIYKLFDLVDRPVAYVKENRKGILGDLLYTLMQKALSSSPKLYWGQLSQNMIKNLKEKHMLVFFQSPEIQKAMEKINFAGRIRRYDGDYLHINDTNFAGAKANLFVSEAVTSTTDIKADGTVERTVKIEYKNPFPHSDCNLERGGLCLNATLRNWLRIYVPAGAKLISFQGSTKPVQTYEDLGKTVFEGFMTVQPLGKAVVMVKYQLPFTVKDEKDYTLLVQKQPGTKGHAYTIIVNNKERLSFPLITDKELKPKDLLRGL